MTLPRSSLIDRSTTPYYHCVSRCVRQAFLCGQNFDTGDDFEHRRAWIEQRLQQLAGIFDIDLCAYAVMSNHYHVVLHLGGNHVHWSTEEVVVRWGQLYRIPAAFDEFDDRKLTSLIDTWRERLGSISWFMKCVNEPLARIANKQDGCKGRFWEGRFRSQALLDEAAVIKCMAYVDLNPVRALLAATPEASVYTAVLARVEGRDQALAPMKNQVETGFRLPIALTDYLELVDWTGRQMHANKRGAIAACLPPIIERLAPFGLPDWLADMRQLTRRYCRAIGSPTSLLAFRDRLGQQRLNGLVC